MARASKAATAKKAAAKKTAAKKTAGKKTAAKKATGKKTTAKKATGKKTTAKKAKSAAKKSATATKAAGTAKRTKKTTVSKKSESGSKAKTARKAATKKAAGKSSAGKSSTGKSSAEASGRKPKKTRSSFDTRFLEQMRKLLNTERDTYERQAKNLRAEADSLVADLDPGDVQFDEESGEGDTIAVERNRDLALAAKALEMIEEIDHALSKFDDGTYGVCEVSGEPIPKERLEAIPWAREKVEYKVGGFGRR